ncbi:MAG: tetratricopeptide repeat protein [Pseudomonadota bacterium]
MKSLGLSIVLATLAACGASPGVAQSEPTAASIERVRAVDQSGEVIYHVLLGEIASNRGDADTAVQSYLTAALMGDDVEVAERAMRIAIEYERWAVAAEAGRHWAALDPAELDVQRLLAGVYLRAGDAPGAAAALEQVLSLSGQSFDAGATSVLAALQQEVDSVLAVEVAKVLVTRHPDSGMAHFVLGQLHADQANWDPALVAFDRSLALKADFGRAQLARARVQLQRGETDDGLDTLRAYIDGHPDDAIAHQGLAQMLVERGRNDEAVIALDALHARHGDRPLLVYNLGLLALELESLEQARRYFTDAVSLDPSRVEAHYFLGRIADYERDYTRAVTHYDRVSSGANAFDAGLRAAELSGRVDGLEAGLVRFSDLRARSTSEAGVRIVLAESGLYQYHDDFDGARATLDAGLEQYPADNDLRYARGLLLARLGDETGFEREMRSVLATEPGNAQALNALGYSLADRNVQLDEAADLIAKAIALEPDDAAIIDSLGWLYFRQGDLEGARTQLERAYSLLADAEIAAHLIEVYWRLGEADSARSLLREALDADPDAGVLQSLLERVPELGDSL